MGRAEGMPVVWLQRVPTGELLEVLPHSTQEVACQGELPTAFPHPIPSTSVGVLARLASWL